MKAQEKLMPMLYPLEEYRLKLVRKVVLSSVFMFLAGILFAFIFLFYTAKIKNIKKSLQIKKL